MTRENDVEYEVRGPDGAVRRSGWRTPEGEVLANRRNAERLYERRPGMALFEEIGAHAQGAVATERPNLKAEDLNIATPNEVACACGASEVCSCQAVGLMPQATVDQIIDRQIRKMEEQRARDLGIRTSVSRPQQLKFGDAPGEYGQYKALSPEPISIIHSWGMGFNEGSMLEKLARWQTMHNILDLEKLVWFAVDLLEQERIKQNNL